MAQPSEKVSQRTNLNCEQSRHHLPSTCYVKALSPKGIENPDVKDLQPYTTQEPPGGEAANPGGADSARPGASPKDAEAQPSELCKAG